MDVLKLATELFASGNFAETERLCRDAIGCEPQNVYALALAASAAMARGNPAIAVPLLRAAMQIQPHQAAHAVNLGEAYRRIGRLAEALSVLHYALQHAPDLAATHYNLALALEDSGMIDEALPRMRRAIELQPDIDTSGQLARMQRKRLEASKESPALDSVIETIEKRLAAGIEASERVCMLRELATLHFNLGCLEQAVAVIRQAINEFPKQPSLGSDLLLYTQYHPGYDSRRILDEARDWQRRYVDPLQLQIPPHRNDKSPERRLRIGYVSADFCHHVSTCFTWPLLCNHDHTKFEVFCYSDVKGPDKWTNQLRQRSDCWRDIRALSEAEVAHTISLDKIDILFDLSLHISDSRPLIFAHKPAPVQVCWLGYPGTTGQRAIDYRISDPHLDPMGIDESIYSEQTVRLPDCFWCYHPLLSGLEVGPAPVAETGAFTFGALNSFAKVHDGVLHLWAQLLRRVPRSRLLILAPPGKARRRIGEIFALEGVDFNRLEFIHNLPRRDYFLAYHRVDLALDPFPCNGHTTSMDAYYMGVPVVTLRGSTIAGRAGASIAMNLGLPEFIAHSPEQYLSIAETASNDRSRLATLRRELRRRMHESAIMDGPRFARNFEDACRNLWRDYCRLKST